MPDLLRIIDKIKIKKYSKLLNISKKFSNGSTPLGGKFEDRGVLYYRSQDIGLIEMQKNQYITKEFDEQLLRSRCHVGDILVSVVGSIGKVGYIGEINQEGNINQNISKVTISDGRYLPKYVAIVIDSNLGQIQLQRLATQTVQSYINNEQLGKVLIPDVEFPAQKEIISIMDSAYAQKQKLEQRADELLKSVDVYLLDKLGIDIPMGSDDSLENRMFFVKSESVIDGRLDPKKYSEKYRYIAEAIKNAEFDKVRFRDIITESIAGDWGLDEPETDESLIKCLTIRGTEFDNRYNLSLDNNRVKYRKYTPKAFNKVRLYNNDILIEKSGGSDNQPVGRVAFINEELLTRPLAYSNFLQKIKVDDELAIPEYVFEYLKLIHNIKLTEVMQTQTNGIRNLIMKEYYDQIVVLPKKEIQCEIVQKIKGIRKQAQELEFSAKETVENAKKQVESILLGNTD